MRSLPDWVVPAALQLLLAGLLEEQPGLVQLQDLTASLLAGREAAHRGAGLDPGRTTEHA